MRFTIYGEHAYKLTLADKLLKRGFVRDDENPQYCFSIGGDGTILRAIHKYIKLIETMEFIGINFGRLGFYTDFDDSEMDEVIEMIESKKYDVARCYMIEYLLRSNAIYKSGFGLNELAIINPIHTQIIDVYLNEKHFETFRGTGFIASTPTGSTAYNKSLGGSVIDPNIQAMQLTEVASINNRVYKTISSPLVLSNHTMVKLKSDFKGASITVDGLHEEFKDVEEIVIRLSEKNVRFIVKKETDFWDRVKKSFLE